MRQPEDTGEPLRSRLAAGWRWLRGDRFLLPAAVWVAMLTATFAAVGLVLIVVARERGSTPVEIGAMFAISTAGGAVGAVLTPALQRRFRPAAIFRAAALIDAAATCVLFVATGTVAIGLAGAAAFFLAPAVSASLFGELSARCPDALVGRAQSALTLVAGSAAPLASVGIGAVTDAAGSIVAIGVCAGIFASLLIAALVMPAFRSSPPRGRAAPR